jgi:uncharacterized protein with FMN-binding domain
MRLRPLPSAILLALALGLPGAEVVKDVPAATIAKLVEDSAAGKPDWWDAVPLAYPKTLDLSCPSGQGWKPTVVPGAWMWDMMNPNPARWKEATKFWHFCLANAKQNKLDVAEKCAIQALGHCYGDLLQDWPRALYWYKEAESRYGKDDERTISMAEAYWRLGSRSLAVQTIKPMTRDMTRHGSLINLWAEMGDYDTAYRLAKARIASDANVGWFMTGYTAQLQGDWKKALDAFTQAKQAPEAGSSRDWKQTCARATAAIEAITLFESLDLARVADGTYSDASTGYTGPVGVEVTVAAHRITSVKVTNHHEKQYYASVDEVPARIIAKQQVKGVVATLGATITSEAIVYASAKALHQGMR